jgi:hypothetical protein
MEPMRPYATSALLCALLSLGCSPKRIPGTEIKDTSDTRAIVALIEAYRQAAERRDARAVVTLVSPHYFDEGGTPDPGDDIDYPMLKKRLAEDYARVAALRLDIGVKQIDVKGDHAFAYVFYDERYRVATKAGEIAKRASDDHRMSFVREGGSWRFLAGL